MTCPLASPPRFEAALLHALHHIAVAHRGPLQRQLAVGQEALEAEVGHHGGDHAAAPQPPGLGPGLGDDGHDLVAVDGAGRVLVADHHPVGVVAVERDADVGAGLAHCAWPSRWGWVEPHLGVDVDPVRARPPPRITSAPSS